MVDIIGRWLQIKYPALHDLIAGAGPDYEDTVSTASHYSHGKLILDVDPTMAPEDVCLAYAFRLPCDEHDEDEVDLRSKSRIEAGGEDRQSSRNMTVKDQSFTYTRLCAAGLAKFAACTCHEDCPYPTHLCKQQSETREPRETHRKAQQTQAGYKALARANVPYVTVIPSKRIDHDAGPSQTSQAMESIEPGVFAALQPHSPPALPSSVPETMAEMTVPDTSAYKAQTPPRPPPPQSESSLVAKNTHVIEHMSLPDTPARVTDHGTLSNLRDTTNGSASRELTPLVIDAPLPHLDADNLFDNDNALFGADIPVPGPTNRPDFEEIKFEEDSFGGHDALNDPRDWTVQEVSNVDEMFAIGSAGSDDDDGAEHLHEGYAMLRFSNSYCVITSLNLIIQRDAKYLAAYKAERKKAKEEAKARNALAAYQQEPSQPSQHGDDDLNVGDLEGRPARGLLSNFSEQGGPVSYGIDDHLSSSSRRHRRKKGNSSSANSIAPRDLYLLAEDDILITEPVPVDSRPDSHEWAALPVHPARPEHITQISREHLIFSYNHWQDERWILRVVGNGAVVNEVYYTKGAEIPLQHDDEIYISTLKFDFQLPRTEEEEQNDELHDDVDVGTSPATSRTRRVSSIADAEESEEDQRPKVKLKLKRPKKPFEQEPEPAKTKPAVKGKGKDKSEKPAGKAKAKDVTNGAEASGSPELVKKPERGKKPKAAPDSGADLAKEPKPKPEQASPPVVPINLEPGSVLADLAPEQMPEKRKGPGRPPKNGLLSKRDESGVKRKRREYERRNEPIPDLNTLLAEVRHEQRQRDLQAKAAARGEQPPDLPMPSIESTTRPTVEGGASMPPRDSQGQESQTPLPTDAMLAYAQVRPRQRSPSPIKPEAEFSEEDLKKPSMTYIYIIDEILSSIEGGQADLQTIYDKIQKRWPYYKYRVGSIGWQSSVRHNLLSCERFVDAGKSGKGKFWRINFDHPLDNKKRKSPPPPGRPMQNSQMGPPYGQPGYNGNYGQPNGNGQQLYNGQGNYYSPYPGGPNGQPPPGQAPSGQYGGTSGGPSPHHLNGGAPHQPPQPAETPLTRQVNAIMNFRSHWLAGHPMDSQEYKSRELGFVRAVGYYSYVTSNGQGDRVDLVPGEELLEPFPSMKAIFDRFLSDTADAAAAAPANGAGAPTDQQQPAPVGQQQPQGQQPPGQQMQGQQVQDSPSQGQRIQQQAPQQQPPSVQQVPVDQQQPFNQQQALSQSQQQLASQPAMVQSESISADNAPPPQVGPSGKAPPNVMTAPPGSAQAVAGATATVPPAAVAVVQASIGNNSGISQQAPRGDTFASDDTALQGPAPAPVQTSTTNDRGPPPAGLEHTTSPGTVSSSNLAPTLSQGTHDVQQTPQASATSVPPVQRAHHAVTKGPATLPVTANGTTGTPPPAQVPTDSKSDNASISPQRCAKDEPKSTTTPFVEPTVIELDAQDAPPQSAGIKRAVEADEEDKDGTKRQKTS